MKWGMKKGETYVKNIGRKRNGKKKSEVKRVKKKRSH
jgi:hypothetical protein